MLKYQPNAEAGNGSPYEYPYHGPFIDILFINEHIWITEYAKIQ